MTTFFAAADKDGDGGLTQDEMQAAHENMKKRMGDRDGKRGGHFGRIDADGDGQVTKAEFVAGGEKMFEHLDANGDGKLEPGEGRMNRGGPGARAPEAE
jgi:Ca2+-binding EF-hand superfamily protein